jgi:signal peptidase I
MPMNKRLIRFLFPSLTPRFLIRLGAVALVAYVVFGHLLTPMIIRGSSMEPTYHDGGINFCWRWRYLFSEPARYDVVAVRFAGRKVMLLKRIVALEGEELEFREGRLFVDGMELPEPYVRFPCEWNLPPRTVEKGSVYLIGDNRNMPLETHYFGQVSVKRIVGAPLW